MPDSRFLARQPVNNIVRPAFRSGYLGYAAFGGRAGRGLMTTGMRAVIDAAFDILGLHRLEANIQPANAASIALVRRLGFQYWHAGGEIQPRLTPPGLVCPPLAVPCDHRHAT